MRSILIGVAAAALAVGIGLALAQENYFLATATTVLCGWALLAWVRGPLAEAWVLAFLVCGYVLGNRGFAQIMPLAGVPLFVGEFGLAASLGLVVCRQALARDFPLRRNWVNGFVLLWIALGAGRIAFDVRTFGIIALRDFAMVYYAGFFFVAQAVARHPPSRRLLLRALTVTFSLLPLVALLIAAFPRFFLRDLVVRGVPVILQKGDLLATFLIAGFVWLLPRRRRLGWPRDAGQGGLALLALTLGLVNLSRAAMVGLVAAVVAVAPARWFRPALAILVGGGLGLAGSTTYSLVRGEAFAQTRAYAIYEHVRSLTDFSGTQVYRNPDSVDSGDNNRFRQVWWKTVLGETIEGGPLLGLGFGRDLARGFVLAYDPLMENEFTARSPHSIIFTVIGRMGAAGLVAWLGFMVAFAGATWRVARGVAAKRVDLEPLVLSAMCWVVLVSACFGVVLEGPMGAVPFWILLGLAHHATTRQDAEATAAPDRAAATSAHS